MLQELTIRNFAIIDDLHIGFSEGLTMLTGETGAGKSIIISAVNLILGGRASSDLIRTGSESAEIEALFRVAIGSPAATNMESLGLDYSDGLLIRRIISRQEKHRTFINGRLATVQMLSSITESLASISGQHANQRLLKEELHLLFLDRYGGLMALREKMISGYREITPLIEKLNRLEHLRNKRLEQQSLLEFQKEEILSSRPVIGEDEALENERMRLKHAEMLYQTIKKSIDLLYNSQGSISEQLSLLSKDLLRASQVDSDLSFTVNRLTEMTFQIEDLTDGLRSYLKRFDINDGRLEEITERLDKLNKLKRKYGGTIEAVLEKMSVIDLQLQELETVVDEISETKKTLDDHHSRLCELALILSEKRRKAAIEFSEKVKSELFDLKMEHTAFEIHLQMLLPSKQAAPYLKVGDNVLEETGIDRAVFMIAPNRGEPLKPLMKIASGGELSRVVLALMVVIAKTESVGLVVFDEVDAGTGGGIAEMIGKKMLDLAKCHQIICITHLPQIAKFGYHHYLISKEIVDGRTITAILPLTHEKRIKEIARMLGGVTITQATLDHAQELLNNIEYFNH